LIPHPFSAWQPAQETEGESRTVTDSMSTDSTVASCEITGTDFIIEGLENQMAILSFPKKNRLSFVSFLKFLIF
jgi:hypothetical protein